MAGARWKEERAGAVVEEVDEVFGAADVAADGADSFRERADLDIDAAMAVEVID